jgi:predicted nucleic acid-binding protein
VFVDTGAWYALQVPDDRFHVAATSALGAILRAGYRLVTSTAVVGESYSLLVRTHGHGAAFRFVDALEKSERLEVVQMDAAIEAETYSVLRRFSDQPFSYVDGTSFAIMRIRRLQLAFAFDHHFSVAGHVRVPLDRAL